LIKNKNFADINGELYPSSREITDSKWITNFSGYNLSDITMKIVHSLKKDEYFD